MEHGSRLYIGTNRHILQHSQEGVFLKIGMLMGVSLVQGGSGFPFFAPSMYQYIHLLWRCAFCGNWAL